jgi:hypothetical protein
MAQTTLINQNSMPRKFIEVSNPLVSVPQAGNTEIARISVVGCDRLTAEILVAGQALDAFIVKGKCTRDGADITLFSIATDYTTPAGIVIDASGDLTSQAVGTGWLVLDVRGFYDISLHASSGNVAGSTVSIHAAVS